MQNSTAVWHTQDGLDLFSQWWQPSGETKAVVCLIHGLGEHSSRYIHVAEALTGAGYALIGFDLRGHGRSEGKRGHFPNPQAILADIDLLLAEAERRFPGLPRFIYGHSLGGLLALYYTLQRRPVVQGVISSSPGLRSALVEQKTKILLSKLLKSIVPALTVPTGLDPTDLSHDPAVVQAYRNDPLVHAAGTPGLATTSLEMIDYAFAHAAQFPVPLLVFHGTQDRLTYPAGSQEFSHQVGCDCTLKLWEGLYHETHNEPEKAAVLAYMIGWLDAHLPPAADREGYLPAPAGAAG